MTQNIIITMEGGNVTAVLHTGQPVKITIIEYDVPDYHDDEEVKKIPQSDGTQWDAYINRLDSEPIDQERFNELWKAANDTEPEAAEELETFIVDSDQPTTCPKCGTRTDFKELTATTQRHECLNPKCKFTFIGENQTDEPDNSPTIEIRRKRYNKTDYLETFFEIVDSLSMALNEEGSSVQEQYEQGGRGWLYETAQEWADEFQEKHAATEWDGEFLEVIQEFIEDKIKQL